MGPMGGDVESMVTFDLAHPTSSILPNADALFTIVISVCDYANISATYDCKKPVAYLPTNMRPGTLQGYRTLKISLLHRSSLVERKWNLVKRIKDLQDQLSALV